MAAVVIIEIKEELNKVICRNCGKVITSGENFLINSNNLPRSKFLLKDNKFFYKCSCGLEYELLRSSKPKMEQVFKFKHSKIIEDEFLY